MPNRSTIDVGAQCQIRKELNPEIRQSVWEDNSAFFFDRRVFNSDFFEFMTNLTSKVQIEEQDSSALALESKTTAVLQMASTFALQTVARAEDLGLEEALTRFRAKTLAPGRQLFMGLRIFT